MNGYKANSASTVDVPTDATQVDGTVQTIRAAIEAERLPGVFRKGQWWLRPESVAWYRVSTRNRKDKPSSEVTVRIGSVPGASISIRLMDGHKFVVEGQERNVVFGRFPNGWTGAMVNCRKQ